MLMLLFVLMGGLAWMSMRKEQNPDVQFGVIAVSAIYPGAGPEEVNTLVSRKIEEAVSGIAGLREVTSTSVEGFSTVVASFEVGANMDVALNDVRAKVDAIVNQLPRGVEKPVIDKFDASSDPVLSLVLSSDTLNRQELRDLADDKLKDRFARIPGVAAVTVFGGAEREIQIQVKRNKLLAYGIGISDVQRAVYGATVNAPAGRAVTGEQEFGVRILGEFRTVQEIENTPLSISDPNSFGGKPRVVRLGDVATVLDTTKERRSWSRLDGFDSVAMTVQKAKQGNAIEIDQAADEVIAQIRQEFGVSTVKTFNQAKDIRESLDDLLIALVFGIILVTAIVYLFLHNIRGTIIVGIAIPVCVLATFVVLWALGFTINNMSMLAMSLAVGVLVDDAIVVLENIYRHLRMGEDPRTAAINGRSEIGLAAIAITLADVVVFIPIAFMGGIVGQFFKPLGIGFAVTTLMSLFVSFTVTPMLASRWYREGEDVEHPAGGFAKWFEDRFHRFAEGYRRMLSWALRHRWFVFISGWVVLFSVFMMIAGSFAQDVGGAISTTMGPFMAAVALGLVVFGANYWPKALSAKGWLRFRLFGILVFMALMLGAPMPAPAPAKVLLGFLLFWPVAGLLGFLANLFHTRARARIVGQAALFGLVFPVAALVGLAFASWKQEPIFKFAFFPPSDAGSVQIGITLPPGASLAQTEDVIEEVESRIKDHPDVKFVRSDVGRSGGGFGGGDNTGTNYGQVNVTLNDRKALMDSILFWMDHGEELRTRVDNAVAADMLERIGKIPGAEVTVSTAGGVGFGAPIQMGFASDDRELLVRTTTEIKRRLEAGEIEGVITPELSSKPGKPEIRAVPDRVRLADVGLSTAELAGSLRVLYEGDFDTKFRVSGREYDIRVMMDLQDRNDPDTVSQVPITFVQGRPIFLSDVASLERGVSTDKIERRNREEEIRISANLLPGFAAGTVQREIDQWMERENLVPEGVKIKPLGQADVQARESGYLFSALLMGLVLVYMLLASLYDNLLYPFIIQLAQPQAMVGALLALILTDKTLNIVGFVGIITLVGLVGKNAILLVDYTNTLRQRGKDRMKALLEAGPTRLRPIMMTTLALILGMLPVALAIGRGSEFRETIGITIIGGITLSTLLTLFVIPSSYTIFDDFSLWLGNKIRGYMGRERAERAFEGPEPLEEVASEAERTGARE
jgi:hydrophobic/amphiphilic exporter-1 (mainly G- bacteria), HAE1 family